MGHQGQGSDSAPDQRQTHDPDRHQSRQPERGISMVPARPRPSGIESECGENADDNGDGIQGDDEEPTVHCHRLVEEHAGIRRVGSAYGHEHERCGDQPSRRRQPGIAL